MIPEDYLLITEIDGTGQQHKISLERLRQGPITVGRVPTEEQKKEPNFRPRPNHIYIGGNARTVNWISSCQCTLLAKENPNSPRGWDYFVHDGCSTADGNWKLSKNGIWVGHRQITGFLELRPGLSGNIVIFPKLQNGLIESNYHSILEWPAHKESGDDTDPPTLQQYQAVQMERRIFEAEAAQAKQQLEQLAKNMGQMQVQFIREREELGQKINDQSDVLLKLSNTLEKERDINRQQENQLAARRKAEKKIKLGMLVLGLSLAAIAAFALNLDHETIKNIFEWSTLIVGAVVTALGLKGMTE